MNDEAEAVQIANPKLVASNKHRANKIAIASVLIAAAATAGLVAIPLR